MLDRIIAIAAQIDEAARVFNSTADWEIKYTIIFGMKIHSAIREAGFDFEWYDPDTDYQEDVTAYHHALQDFRKKLGDLVDNPED